MSAKLAAAALTGVAVGLVAEALSAATAAAVLSAHADGDLFAKRPALDREKATSAPAVSYMALPATAAGKDTELFGRVITQDLKHLCSQRMRSAEPEDATEATPVLVCYDEFATLRVAPQIVDLLLQARQPRCRYCWARSSYRRTVLSASRRRLPA